jgi:hypothetical protein
MSMVGFPLLLIPLAIYNIIVLLMPGVTLAEPLLTLALMSGAEWRITLSDILLALGILLLLFEVIKGARPGAKYLTDHLLSLIVFGGAVAEFLLLSGFGTSTYFLLALLALVDFLSGIALRAGRGTMGAAAGASRPTFRRRETDAPEPPSSSAVRSSVAHVVPGGAPVAVDEFESKSAHTEVAPAVASPGVEAPSLQPGEASPPPPDTLRR